MTLIYPFLIECFVISNNTQAYCKRLSFIMTETEKGINDFQSQGITVKVVFGWEEPQRNWEEPRRNWEELGGL